MSIGSRIKQARLNLGISQEELAYSIGVTKGAIGNYETDVSCPKERILILLMHALNIDANYIYQDYIQSVDYSVKQNCKIDISEQERNLLLAYRAHPDMQNAVNTLLGIKNVNIADKQIPVYRAARSSDDHEDEMTYISKERLQRIKDAPETDENL